MPDRPAELIDLLNLRPHPEGGHYTEIYRSADAVAPADGCGVRAALTTIYFLLRCGEMSRWHRVTSGEMWHFYEGGGLDLLRLSPGLEELETHRLGPVASASGVRPTAIIPAGHWQTARPAGEGPPYALVGCTVGSGFDFADFTMLADDPAADEACRRHPVVAPLL